MEEGLAKIAVPKLDLYRRPDGVIEPAWMPVFYNPQAAVSRDLTSVFIKSIFGEKEFLFVDLLSGTGIRGIRIVRETGGYGILNDIDPRAYYYIRKNIELNNLEDRLEAYNNEANALLNTLVLAGVFVDYLDVDPYGSPVPFLDSVFKPIGREAYIGITATDTAPLTCTYPHKALSRYWSKCIKLDFEKEYAARLLIANIVMRASALEIELRPVLTLVFQHFIRTFFIAKRTASGAYRVFDECIGYLWYCKETLERGFIKNPEELREVSCKSSDKPMLLGRVWICELSNIDLVTRALAASTAMTWLKPETVKLLGKLKEEASIIQPYFRLDKLCSVLKVTMPSIKQLVDELRNLGIKCSRTHMDPRGLRVQADYITLVNTLIGIARKSEK